MATVFDYFKWRGDITFSEVGLTEVDAMLFSMISYNYFEQIFVDYYANASLTLQELGTMYFEDRKKDLPLGAIIPPTSMKAFREMCRLSRYKDIVLTDFEYRLDSETTTQFCAMTLRIGNGTSVILFRGTDDTLIGWKENLYLPFVPAIGAQLSALEYFVKAAEKSDDDFYIVGHSKGGIMAIYSAAYAPSNLQNRIRKIYSMDGPGSNSGLFQSDGYIAVKDKFVHLIPQNSLVGLLMDSDGHYDIVKSKNIGGAFQHDCFSWDLMGSKFIRVNTLPSQTLISAESNNIKISTMTKEEIEEVISTLSTIINSTGAVTLSDLTEKAILNIITMIKTLGTTDKALKDKMYSILIQLLKFKYVPKIEQ